MKGIGDLPEDVLEYILLHLGAYAEELGEARLVCRKWERVGRGALIRASVLLERASVLTWERLGQGEGKLGAGIAAERCSHSAVFRPADGSVYVFGGCTNAYTTFNDLWRLHCGTRKWERIIPRGSFPSPKACASLCLHGAELVLFGGWSKSSPNPIHQTSIFFNELHVFEPRTQTWRAIEAGAPHLAGHSASVVGDRMLVFGGSHGSTSTNAVWAFDFGAEEWSQPPVEATRPLPRYGQSQTLLDEETLLIVGGCGGPNLIFNDAWLLRMPAEGPWRWEELKVTNPLDAAPQLWSHPSCRVGERLITLSKGCKTRLEAEAKRKEAQAKRLEEEVAGRLLLPPRRKLLSSRSLDHKDPDGGGPKLPSKADGGGEKGAPELQRASSIPAIIVGEIPKLVVTPEAALSVHASALLPNQGSAPPPPPLLSRQARKRATQLEMLQNMEDRLRTRRADAPGPSAPFRPDSPPPRGKDQPLEDSGRAEVSALNRMEIYALDLSRALSEGEVSWAFVAGVGDGPEDRILYSLVEANGELISFGGMRNGTSPSLGVASPFMHPITNHTFVLRPPIPFC